MNHLEIEFKTMLTEKEYENLLPFFNSTAPVRQVNYYIDSSDRQLQQARMALRLRTFDDRAELTLKIPQKIGNMEYNQELSAQESQNILDLQLFPAGQLLSLLAEKQISVKELNILGSLETIRLEKTTEIGLLALDQSHYFGKTDYELELEVADYENGRKTFHQFLSEHGIEHKAGKSKIARFAENL